MGEIESGPLGEDPVNTSQVELSQRGRPRDPAVDQAILSAALELLASSGYAQLTMEQIAARAEVGKASLYLRWPNKVALVAEAIQHHAAVVPEVPDTGSLREDMLRFLLAVQHERPAAQQALAAVSGEIASNPELRNAWRRSLQGTLSECIARMVERAIERRELPAASDVELLSMLPLTLLQNWRLQHGHAPDEAVIERIVNQFYSPSPLPTPSPETPIPGHTGGREVEPGEPTRDQ